MSAFYPLATQSVPLALHRQQVDFLINQSLELERRASALGAENARLRAALAAIVDPTKPTPEPRCESKTSTRSSPPRIAKPLA